MCSIWSTYVVQPFTMYIHVVLALRSVCFSWSVTIRSLRIWLGKFASSSQKRRLVGLNKCMTNSMSVCVEFLKLFVERFLSLNTWHVFVVSVANLLAYTQPRLSTTTHLLTSSLFGNKSSLIYRPPWPRASNSAPGLWIQSRDFILIIRSI